MILALVALALAVVWIEPELRPDARELRLRLREPAELITFVRRTARDLGEELARRASEPGDPAAPVASGALAGELPREELKPDERERLDRLIEQKLDED